MLLSVSQNIPFSLGVAIVLFFSIGGAIASLNHVKKRVPTPRHITIFQITSERGAYFWSACSFRKIEFNVRGSNMLFKKDMIELGPDRNWNRTGTGITSEIQYRYRPATGTGTRLCNRYRYQALSLVPITKMCYKSYTGVYGPITKIYL